MTSTYSTLLQLELIGSGDQANAWGNTTNNNLQYGLEYCKLLFVVLPQAFA